MKVLETERLLIRHFELGDLEAIHREVYSDPEVCHFFCRNTRTLEHTERWLRYHSYQSEHEQWGLMAVVPKETGEVVGLCGLQPYAGLWLSLESTPEDLRKYAPLEVELTYAFGKAHWGKGYAYEAWVAMMAFLLAVTIGLQLAGPQILRSFIDMARAGAPLKTLAGVAVLFLVVA